MNSTQTKIARALVELKRGGGGVCVIVQEGGRGSYDFQYDSTKEIRSGSGEAILVIEDSWASPHESNYFSYHTFVRLAGFDESELVLFDSLPARCKDYINALPDVDQADEIAKQL